MSTATSSVTTSDPSWSAPTTQAMAQQWQTPEQYQQYYNYYQSMNQVPVATTSVAAPAVTSTAAPTDPAAAPYIQDYSKAWEEYYKAYYGQSYTVSAPPTQYPATGYSYDPYAYPNMGAPPPVYQYDSGAAVAASQYPQPQPVAPTSTAAYPYADPAYAAPPAPAAAWPGVPPTYEQTGGYAPSQAYQQPAPFDKPPPVFEQGGPYAAATGAPYSQPPYDSTGKSGSNRGRSYNKEEVRSLMDIKDDFRPPVRNNRFEQSSKPPSRPGNYNDRPPYENDERSAIYNHRHPVDGNNASSEYNNYDQHQYVDNSFNEDKNAFRAPPYGDHGGDSSYKDHSGSAGYGGRGGASNYGGREAEAPYGGRDEDSGYGRDISYRGRGGDSTYGPRGSENSFRGRGGDAYNNRGDSSYGGRGNGASYGNRGDATYGGRGSEPSYGGRGDSYGNRGDSYGGRGNNSSYRGRGGDSSFESRREDGHFRGGADSPYRGRGGEHAPFRGRGGDSFRGRGGMDGGFRGRGGGEGAGRGRGGFDHVRRSSGEGQESAAPQRWGGREPKEETEVMDTKKDSPWATEDSDETDAAAGWKRKATPDAPAVAAPVKKGPQALMDLVVRPSSQSPVVVRRQGLVDQWQAAVRALPSPQQHWPALKAALVPEVQGLLAPSFVRTDGGSTVHCELHLDDIFLVQGRAASDDQAIEEAARALWQLLQHRLYVHTASRQCGQDKVPVFSVSRAVAGPVSVPPFVRPSAAAVVKDETAAKETNESAASATKATTAVVPQFTPAPSNSNFKEDDIFLVVEAASHHDQKDQSIAVLNNTAKFNKISIDYKHEKPAQAPHISQCLITINGQEFEKSEARDYLVAKREAAEKAVLIFKESCPQIVIGYERAREVARDDLVAGGKPLEEAVADLLKQMAAADAPDDIVRFAAAFTGEERDAVAKAAGNLNLAARPDGKTSLVVFKQYPVEEMKKRILRHGFCAQYRLVVHSGGSGLNNDNNNIKAD